MLPLEILYSIQLYLDPLSKYMFDLANGYAHAASDRMSRDTAIQLAWQYGYEHIALKLMGASPAKHEFAKYASYILLCSNQDLIHKYSSKCEYKDTDLELAVMSGRADVLTFYQVNYGTIGMTVLKMMVQYDQLELYENWFLQRPPGPLVCRHAAKRMAGKYLRGMRVRNTAELLSDPRVNIDMIKFMLDMCVWKAHKMNIFLAHRSLVELMLAHKSAELVQYIFDNDIATIRTRRIYALVHLSSIQDTNTDFCWSILYHFSMPYIHDVENINLTDANIIRYYANTCELDLYAVATRATMVQNTSILYLLLDLYGTSWISNMHDAVINMISNHWQSDSKYEAFIPETLIWYRSHSTILETVFSMLKNERLVRQLRNIMYVADYDSKHVCSDV
jgi:hypothetical protein